VINIANYDSNDLDWTWDGDLILGDDGDLADTSSDLIVSLENEIRTVIRSEFGDWEEHPILGANLSEFLGEANTRQTGNKIREQITSRIVAIGIVKQEDLFVRVVPVGDNQVLVIITVMASSTPANRLAAGSPLEVVFTYDSLEDSVFFMPPSQLELDFKKA